MDPVETQSQKRPVWLLSMDSEEFNAPPTTTASLAAYFQRYGETAGSTRIELVHFQSPGDISPWQKNWESKLLASARQGSSAGLQPVVGFSFYTWNAAEFMSLARYLKTSLPDLLVIAGGPHVQQAEDYLGSEAIDVVFLGEGEASFQEFLDCDGPRDWASIPGLAFLEKGQAIRTTSRQRFTDLDQLPSPLDVLQLTDERGQPRYQSIAYETSRGCPFKCAFCEWGTGAIGSKMHQWSVDRIRRDWQKIVKAGIKDIWLADSNFGALREDSEKAQIIVDLKQKFGLPLSFATSWSKKHSRRVQEIALLLHRNGLLPHYQLALQTLTPEALRLSNRHNMDSNEYLPIAKRMSELGVPIAAELIWGLPGDNLADFEKNLDTLLASFPNINIFGYTLLPGTEFFERRDEYRIEAIPVAGYGKAKGEYVVGCHSFSRDEGEEGYFLITAHILLVHGHIMPLTTRFMALRGEVPVSPLFRQILRLLLQALGDLLPGLDAGDRMTVYEARDRIFLAALGARDKLYEVISDTLALHLAEHGLDPSEALHILQLDRALCPRPGSEHLLERHFDFDAADTFDTLSRMALPASGTLKIAKQRLHIRHPGGLGEILQVADGGSWLQGIIEKTVISSSDIDYVAIA